MILQRDEKGRFQILPVWYLSPCSCRLWTLRNAPYMKRKFHSSTCIRSVSVLFAPLCYLSRSCSLSMGRGYFSLQSKIQNPKSKIILFLALTLFSASQAFALEAEVKPYCGSPMIHVDGKPISPLTFFGWESGIRRAYRREPDHGVAGIQHHRQSPSKIPTAPAASTSAWAARDRAPCGWTTSACIRAKRPPTRRRTGRAAATSRAPARTLNASGISSRPPEPKRPGLWTPTTKASGNQSLRVDITSAGTDHMHLHWYQTGYSVKAMQKYTYSLWMKADKPRTVDFMMLHINDPWTIYPAETAAGSPYVQQVRLARDAGVHIYSFGIADAVAEPGQRARLWRGRSPHRDHASAGPAGAAPARFGMPPPEWWLAQHPDDRMLFDDGKTVSMSMASEAWRAEMQVASARARPPLRVQVRRSHARLPPVRPAHRRMVLRALLGTAPFRFLAGHERRFPQVGAGAIRHSRRPAQGVERA